MTANWDGISFEGDENVLKVIVMVAQHCILKTI